MYPKHDFHTHSIYSDGDSEPAKLVESAVESDLRSIAITDHGPGLAVGMRPNRITEVKRDMKFLKKDSEIPVFWGMEANIIDSESNLDITVSVEGELDFVMAGIHSHEYSNLDSRRFAQKYLERLINAVKNREVDVISHPFWYNEDLSSYLEIDDIISFAEIASRNGVALELNGRYHVPNDRVIDACLNTEIKFSLGSDAHSPEKVGDIEWGIEMLEKRGLGKERLIFADMVGD